MKNKIHYSNESDKVNKYIYIKFYKVNKSTVLDFILFDHENKLEMNDYSAVILFKVQQYASKKNTCINKASFSPDRK